jgi:hypothetical protein
MWQYLAIGSTATSSPGLAQLVNGDAYALQEEGYVPTIPPRRATAGLGGYGPYETVTEPLNLYAIGATPADALRNAQWLLDQVERARLLANLDIVGPTSPILLYAQALCSDVVYDALILDVAAEPLVLSPTPQQEGTWVIPITLTITRMAEWRTVIDTQSSGAADQPALQTVTFTGTDATESPANVAVTWGSPGTLTAPLNAQLLWAPQASVALLTAPATAPAAWIPATGWSSVADAAANNAPANVLRYTATGTAEAPTALDPLTPAGVHPLSDVRTMRRPLVLLVCRSNSATAGFLIRAEGVDDGGSTVRSRMTPVPYNSGQPQILLLGIMSNYNFLGGLRLVAQAVSAAGSPTLDISQVAVIDTASPLAKRVAFKYDFTLASRGLGARAYEPSTASFGIQPIAGIASGGGNPSLTFPVTRYAGDPYLTVGTLSSLNPASVTMAAVLLATHTQYWRLTRTGPLPISGTLVVNRRRSVRVPQ